MDSSAPTIDSSCCPEFEYPKHNIYTFSISFQIVCSKIDIVSKKWTKINKKRPDWPIYNKITEIKEYYVIIGLWTWSVVVDGECDDLQLDLAVPFCFEIWSADRNVERRRWPIREECEQIIFRKMTRRRTRFYFNKQPLNILSLYLKAM